jgi:FdhD protein
VSRPPGSGPPVANPISGVPRLTHADAALTHELEVLDEFGERRRIAIPAERPLTVFVDRRELVTLMTLGAAPELLVLGYLRNQRLVQGIDDVESITVDWDVASAAVKTRYGIVDLEAKTARRVVTTGCGQGTVFGDLMGEIDTIVLPDAADASARLSQAALYRLLNAVRLQETTYKSAGSVHGCALFRQDEMLCFVEDVGRHNAIDTIAGWMWLQGMHGRDKIFYTTGRLTSEMVIKSAQMEVPIIVSRSGITQMGLELAQRLGMCLFGRASNRHFICYCGFDRFDAEPERQAAPAAPASPSTPLPQAPSGRGLQHE